MGFHSGLIDPMSHVPHESYRSYRSNCSSLSARIKTPTIKSHPYVLM